MPALHLRYLRTFGTIPGYFFHKPTHIEYMTC